MSKSIRVSDELIEEARSSGTLFHRSPPQQIEHWAQIGRVMEVALSYSTQAKLKTAATRRALNNALDMVGTEEGIAKAHSVIKQNSINPVSRD